METTLFISQPQSRLAKFFFLLECGYKIFWLMFEQITLAPLSLKDKILANIHYPKFNCYDK